MDTQPSAGESSAVDRDGGAWSPVLVYCLLAFGITWLGVSPLVAQGLGFFDGGFPDAWHAVGALGPLLAALIATRMAFGARGLADFHGTLTRWRIPMRWWLVAVGSPLVLLAVGVAAARLATGAQGFGPALAEAASRPSWWLEVAVASVAFGLGEEPGWRGFLLPQLMRRRSALRATGLIALIWASWHAPFFAYRYDFEGPATVVGFLIAMAAGALWLSFLYLSTDASVPVVAMWHIVWNVVNMVAAEMSPLVVGVMNGGMILLGFGVGAVFGSGLRWPGEGGSGGSIGRIGSLGAERGRGIDRQRPS